MVPDGWNKRKLGSVLTGVVGGGTPSKDEPLYWNGGIPWASVKDVVAGRQCPTDRISELGLQSSAARLVSKQSVIMATRMAVGVVHQFDTEVAINQDLKALIPNQEMVSEFLYWLGTWKGVELAGRATGSTVKGIRVEEIQRLQILLPPLPEQKKIAEILTSVDDAIAATKAVIEQTKQVKKGLLQELLTKGIGHTKFKMTPIGEIPESWEISQLGRVSDVRSGVAKNGNRVLVDPVTLPYLRVANVQDGWLDLSEIKEITVDQKEVSRFRLERGDILMTEGGDIDKLGRGYIWDDEVPGALHQNHVFSVRSDRTLVEPVYLGCFASSPMAKRYFLRVGKQTTNLASINKTLLREMPILVPPLAEQRKIGGRVLEVDAAIRAAKTTLLELDTVKQGLLQNLLTGQIRVITQPLD